ncbi:hypothetical protein FE784_22215 [Paenibacillus hemerocallicola]|uniref:Uncharacterized protein n=1 Tax=Paenibacillus hemerocallicola TaxID=1172614 RepID=A0A5C4T5C7_9BACL|nr:hypothetical protein [Paenibacillus hemerocallicola]TNJ64026.1 hypothetical protein FE784_22215 [Paenibacillus hemerocallicola]
MNIVTIEHEKVLLGANFTSHNTLKEFCMGLSEESNDSPPSGNLLAIYNYSDSVFFAGSFDGKQTRLSGHSVVSAVFPDGVYLKLDSNSVALSADFLIQTTYREDHHNLFVIEEYDFVNRLIWVYYPLRTDGVDLTKLTRLPAEQATQLKAGYVEKFTTGYNSNETPYLWERLIQYNPMKFEAIYQYVREDEDVCFFWDAHSSLGLLYSLGREHIFKLLFKEVMYHYKQKNIPEDVYLFNESLSWTIALTHEPQNEHDWKCFSIGLSSSRV